MQKQLWKTVRFLAALLATSTALGQSNQGDTIADIPFAFTVANLLHSPRDATPSPAWARRLSGYPIPLTKARSC